MSEPNFDTLAATQKLQDSSFERQQAEGIIGVIVDAQQNLVTKDDLNQVEDRLTGKIDALGVRLGGDIKALSGKIDAVEDRLTGKIDAQGVRLDGDIKVLDGKIDALGVRLDDKFEMLSGKIDAQGDSLKSSISSLRSLILGAVLPVWLTILGVGVAIWMKLP